MSGLEHSKPQVVIVGAGVTGATLAALLGKNGVNCALIETSAPDLAQERSSNSRILAMTLATARILQAAGAWQNISEEQLGKFCKMHVWDRNGGAEIHFDSNHLLQAMMGYIVEQKVLLQALFVALKNIPNISFYQPATVVACDVQEEHVRVELDNSQTLLAKLVLATDGGNSKIRQLSGLAWQKHDYQQQAITSVVSTEKAHGKVARQCFFTEGTLAFLPMVDPHQCGIVWSTSEQHANDLLAMNEQIFKHELAVAFEHQLGKIVRSYGGRTKFSLQRAHAPRYCVPRIALVGDSAHQIHPLAGQGANLGILDAASLAEILLQAVAKNRDIGSMSMLRRYERWRKGENYMMMMMMDGFKCLFENQNTFLTRLRNIGLELVDRNDTIKKQMMRYAMGMAGDLPVVARPKN